MISEENTGNGAGSAIVVDDGVVINGGDAVQADSVVDAVSKDETTINRLECNRCSWCWYPRTPARPKVCPKCKSPYYDQEYTKFISEDRKARRWDDRSKPKE